MNKVRQGNLSTDAKKYHLRLFKYLTFIGFFWWPCYSYCSLISKKERLTISWVTKILNGLMELGFDGLFWSQSLQRHHLCILLHCCKSRWSSSGERVIKNQQILKILNINVATAFDLMGATSKTTNFISIYSLF